MLTFILKHIRRDIRGATAIEYGLIVMFMTLVIISGVAAVGSKMTSTWCSISQSIGASGC